MSNFEKICRNTSRKLSAYTREHCIKLGLMNGPKKQVNSRSNYQRVNNLYKNTSTRHDLNPALQFLGSKRVGIQPKKESKWVSNGRGGWVRASVKVNSSVKPKSAQTVSNGRNKEKLRPMVCNCKTNNQNGRKYCKCNVPDIPLIHKRWVATNF